MRNCSINTNIIITYFLRNNNTKQETNEHQWFAHSHTGHPAYKNYHSQIPDAHQWVKSASLKRSNRAVQGHAILRFYDHKGRSNLNCLDLPLWVAWGCSALWVITPEISCRLPA